MRHYFGYDINGRLRSVEVYGPIGWPADKCMADPSCVAEAVTSLREQRSGDAPEIINWVLYDCSCDPGQGHLLRDCKCFNTQFAEHTVDVQNKVMVPKPLRTVYIDDVVVGNRDIVTRAPGTAVVLKIVSAGMPDGEKALCTQGGAVDLTLDDAWELTFSNGETDTKTLVAPSQGTKGGVGIGGKLMRPLIFYLRGFASA